MAMSLREFFEDYYRRHETAQPMPQQPPVPFPSGRCPMCQRPLDDHTQGRCPK